MTRGIHAEPWDKYISVATGSVFGAWVDLRPGKSFGEVYTCVIDPSKAIYVPRGVGNSFQALEDGTAYTYLVNAHWSAELKKTYTFVNLADPGLGIEWPIPLSECELSEADRDHPMLADALPMAPRRTLVTGCNGQLGRAVRAAAEERGLPGFDYCDIDTFDLFPPRGLREVRLVPLRRGDQLRRLHRRGPRRDARGQEGLLGRQRDRPGPHGPHLRRARRDARARVLRLRVRRRVPQPRRGRAPSPLSAYGQSKAAGDLAAAGCPRHYVVRSSWVIGDGRNFVRTMRALSDRVADPADALERVTVVDDQLGRLTFTDQMAAGILHLLGYRDGGLEPSAPPPTAPTTSPAPAPWSPGRGSRPASSTWPTATAARSGPSPPPSTTPPPRARSPRGRPLRPRPLQGPRRRLSSRATGLRNLPSTWRRCKHTACYQLRQATTTVTYGLHDRMSYWYPVVGGFLQVSYPKLLHMAYDHRLPTS